jgi:phosphoribosylanthranilate isomerase
VGVFVSAAAWIVNELAAEIGLDVAQHSGDDSWHYCLEVNHPTIKAVHVLDGDTPDTVIAKTQAGMADMVLLDSRAGDRFGGTGRAFDWSVARAVAERLPVILAGGLTPDNVFDAVRMVRPFAVDVSSGVETDGAKDPARIRAFIEAVRAADAIGAPRGR